MKTGKILEIENVLNANQALTALLMREKSESAGLGLFFGRPGLGKSRWAMSTALKKNYYYLRLEHGHTTRSFLGELLVTLKYRTARASDVCGSAKDIYNEVLDFLQNEPNVVILIDEIDYGFRKAGIIATIRDMVDQSFVSIVLIGMHTAKQSLLKLNAHYFDRCNAFCEFKNISQVDVGKLLSGISEVSCDDELVEYLHRASNGTLRLLIKHISNLEKIGKRLKKSELRYRDIKDLL
jgi:hypothetical protein